jgi:hypothetical protein
MYGCESLGHLPIEETAEITVARHLGEAVDFLWGLATPMTGTSPASPAGVAGWAIGRLANTVIP